MIVVSHVMATVASQIEASNKVTCLGLYLYWEARRPDITAPPPPPQKKKTHKHTAVIDKKK